MTISNPSQKNVTEVCFPQCNMMSSRSAGFSGLVTACRAAELGLSVAVLEARPEDRYPCSSRYATGAVNVMGLPILSEPDRLYAAILDGSGPNAKPAVARALANSAKRAIEWLSQQGAQFTSRALRHEQPGSGCWRRRGLRLPG